MSENEKTAKSGVGLGDLSRVVQALEEEVKRLSENPPPRALKAVGEWRVVLLSVRPVEMWVVLGEHGDYLVIPRLFCSCPHYTIKVLQEREAKPCYHLIAVELAKRMGRFVRLSVDDAGVLAGYVVEILLYGRAPSLRAELLKEAQRRIAK